ncbi:DEAD/DEAH box helicase [Paraburkholderia elongata]|uniref:DEAD/DEAH box helicase n=1 Tax=Paraburkholderia elongata TaxID=2675747 RepID=UPI001C1321A2
MSHLPKLGLDLKEICIHTASFRLQDQPTGALRYIVVDELHAFIGSERGKQLQSLMHRVERICGRRVPRVGLSATLGDMQLAARFFRAGGEGAVGIIDSKSGGQELKVLIKGFVLRPPRIEVEPDLENPVLEDAVAG